MAGGANPADVARISRHLRRFADELDGPAAAKRGQRLGRKLTQDVGAAVRSTRAAHGTLADQSMSGWRRGKPIRIGARAVAQRDGGVLVTPDRGAGPMRVLEEGRQARGKGDVVSYERRNRKGDTVTRNRKVRRTAGATKGKGTWTTARRKMDRTTRQFMRQEWTEAFRRSFR